MPTPTTKKAELPKAKLAYCDKCNPKVAVGWGAFPATAKSGHIVGGVLHDGKFVEIEDGEVMNPGESIDAFLSRMLKKYVTK